jgi:hypothetical protein
MIVAAIDRGDLYFVRNLVAVRSFDVDLPESSRLAHERQFARLVAVHYERTRIVHHMDRWSRARAQILNQVSLARIKGDRNLTSGILSI